MRFAVPVKSGLVQTDLVSTRVCQLIRKQDVLAGKHPKCYTTLRIWMAAVMNPIINVTQVTNMHNDLVTQLIVWLQIYTGFSTFSIVSEGQQESTNLD